MKRLFRTVHADRIGGLFLIAVAVFLLKVGLQLPFGRLNAPDSGFLPIVLATLLLLIGIAIFANSFWTPAPEIDFTSRSWAVPIAAASLLLYAALVDRIGFLICTFAILFLFMKVYGRLKWHTSLLISTSLVLVTYFGFKELGVPLPRGIFGLA